MNYTHTSAEVSGCGKYRYRLERRWREGPMMRFIMLNPSTADGRDDDPTIRKCVGFADRNGHGGIQVVNLFAFRTFSPAVLRHYVKAQGPDFVIGESNDWHIDEAAAAAKAEGAMIVAAWGLHGKLEKRGDAVTLRLRMSGHWLHCIGTNQDGTPIHPLMPSYDRQLGLFL